MSDSLLCSCHLDILHSGGVGMYLYFAPGPTNPAAALTGGSVEEPERTGCCPPVSGLWDLCAVGWVALSPPTPPPVGWQSGRAGPVCSGEEAKALMSSDLPGALAELPQVGEGRPPRGPTAPAPPEPKPRPHRLPGLRGRTACRAPSPATHSRCSINALMLAGGACRWSGWIAGASDGARAACE